MHRNRLTIDRIRRGAIRALALFSYSRTLSNWQIDGMAGRRIWSVGKCRHALSVASRPQIDNHVQDFVFRQKKSRVKVYTATTVSKYIRIWESRFLRRHSVVRANALRYVVILIS